MLNKLLKSCMPWMDKGRWCAVQVLGNSEDGFYARFNGNVFRDVILTPEGENYRLNISVNTIFQIVDWKFCPDDGGLIAYVPGDMRLNHVSDGEIRFEGYIPGTYWFYMR